MTDTSSSSSFINQQIEPETFGLAPIIYQEPDGRRAFFEELINQLKIYPKRIINVGGGKKEGVVVCRNGNTINIDPLAMEFEAENSKIYVFKDLFENVVHLIEHVEGTIVVISYPYDVQGKWPLRTIKWAKQMGYIVIVLTVPTAMSGEHVEEYREYIDLQYQIPVIMVAGSYPNCYPNMMRLTGFKCTAHAAMYMNNKFHGTFDPEDFEVDSSLVDVTRAHIWSTVKLYSPQEYIALKLLDEMETTYNNFSDSVSHPFSKVHCAELIGKPLKITIDIMEAVVENSSVEYWFPDHKIFTPELFPTYCAVKGLLDLFDLEIAAESYSMFFTEGIQTLYDRKRNKGTAMTLCEIKSFINVLLGHL